MEQEQQTLKIKIGTFEAEYILYRTKAPPNYDSGGTITVRTEPDGERVVLILKEEENWHLGRYGSGLYGCEREELDNCMIRWLTEKLYKRLFKTEAE